MTAIDVDDGLAVAGGVRGGLRLFDVRNPRAPRLLAAWRGWTSTWRWTATACW